jgi:hypothetical protein
LPNVGLRFGLLRSVAAALLRGKTVERFCSPPAVAECRDSDLQRAPVLALNGIHEDGYMGVYIGRLAPEPRMPAPQQTRNQFASKNFRRFPSPPQSGKMPQGDAHALRVKTQ